MNSNKTVDNPMISSNSSIRFTEGFGIKASSILEEMEIEPSVKANNSLNEFEFTRAIDQYLIKREREQNTQILVLEIDSKENYSAVYKFYTLRSLLHELLEEIKIVECGDCLQFQYTTNSNDTVHSVLPLRLRDLRRLDFTINPNEELTIQVRRYVVLLTVDPLRAIITNQKLRLIVPPGGDSELSILQHYTNRLRDKTKLSRRFELYMYEYVLSSLKELLLIKQESLTSQVTKYISYLRTGAVLSPLKNDSFNHLKDVSLKFERKLKSYDTSLRNILNDDETLALMNISLFSANPALYHNPLIPSIMTQHEETKEIIEAFFTDLTSMNIKLKLVRNQIHNAETHLSLTLDLIQNRVLQMNTVLSLISFNFSFSTYISSIFGMNLNMDTFQELNGVFAAVFVATFVLSWFGISALYYYFIYVGAIQIENKVLEKKYLS